MVFLCCGTNGYFVFVTVDIVVGMWIGMTGHMVDVIAARV